MFTPSKVLVVLFVAICLFNAAVSARPLRVKRCSPKSPSSHSSVSHTSTHTSAPSAAPSPAANPSSAPGGCFPSAGFHPPAVASGKAPSTSVSDWWCSRESEYAFMGFSYAVDSCPSKAQLTSDFKRMKNSYGARYVRIYAACDNDGFYDNVVEAGYEAGVGIYSLIWFGFTGDDSYKGRWNQLLNTIENNPLAPYVIRNVACGSEPLFDDAISVSGLTSLIAEVKAKVEKFGIQVSVSEMPSAYGERSGSGAVLDAVDHYESNNLPFFSDSATTGGAAWSYVQGDINFYKSKGTNKKIFLTENGWPTNQDVWKANSGSAVASVSSQEAYFKLLDSKCSYFKSLPGGGGGWFFHIFLDDGLPGWGLIQSNGSPKFDFSARSSC